MALRETISRILIKWHMPTRQAAIIEIEQAFREAIKRAKPAKFHGADLHQSYYNGALDKYERNLLKMLEGNE